MGIWPLPGGVDKYAETLHRCLDYVMRESPTFENLMKWFVDNYPGVKGGRSTEGYVYTVTEVLSLAQRGADGRLRLTEEGKDYVKTEDYNFLFKILDSRVAGISQIVDILKAGPLTLSDLNEQLKVRLKREWATENQAFFRACWLMSLGVVKRVGHTYVLTTGGPVSALSGPVVPTATRKQVLTPTPAKSANDFASFLEKTQRDTTKPAEFEEAVAQCFSFLGFESEHIGGPGKADVLLLANIGSLSYKVVIDAKTSAIGGVGDSRIDWMTLNEHRKKNGAKYVAVVGSGFESERVQERAKQTGVTLIPTQMLIEVMKLQETTPFDLIELEGIFKDKGVPTSVRDQLEQYASEFDSNCTLLAEMLNLLYTKGKEFNAEQIQAVLDTGGVPCNEEQVRLVIEFLASPPISVVNRNEKGRVQLRASPPTIARKLRTIESRITAK